MFWHTKVVCRAPPRPHTDINPADPHCPSIPVAFTNMKTTIILFLGILALCAQLQAVPVAAGSKGECWGAWGGCLLLALGALRGCLGLGSHWNPVDEQTGAIPQHRARHIPSSGASVHH